MTIRVMLVDDHSAYRSYLRALLSREPDLQVVAEESSGLDATRRSEEIELDLVIIEVRLPGMDGI